MHRIILIAPWVADFGHGILITVLLLLAFDKDPLPVYFALGILFSIIPDLDGVKEFIKFKNVGASKGRSEDHRDGLHFPLVWLIGGLIFIFITPFYGTLFLVAVMVHFFNDSWGTGWGVQWLWPFSKKSYKLFSGSNTDAYVDSSQTLASWSPEEKAVAIESLGNPNWLRDIYLRPTPISIIEYGTFIVALIVLAWFLL
jgi:membrane-bound metal-dependent hydrolase YbcI (DUF457 family)